MFNLPPTDNGFDRIARVYDILAFLVFGQSLRKAQTALLHYIPDYSSILIIGGGSGWLLQKLVKKAPSASIVYLEASAKMLSFAQQKSNLFPATATVDFRLGNESAIQPTDKFSVVITPFFLDLFTQQRLQQAIMPRLFASLQPGGLWLFTDFMPPPHKFHQLLLKTMYWFFGKLCSIEARQLPEYATLFASYPLQQKASKTFFNGMVETSVWEKTSACKG
ncbi:MAG: class I SAM-dependent methyltransferase [Bacteroidota bacterium]